MNKSTISVRSGVSWIGFSQIIKIALQLVAIITLARILPPTDYGLMAMAGTVTAFASLFRDFGTGSAIIQTKEIDGTLMSTVFWFNLILGLLLSLIVAATAYLIANIFSEPKLSDILLVLSPIFLILSLGIVQQAILERASNFKIIAYIEISSGIIALLLAIIAALNDWGVYALIVQTMVAGVISGILLWFFSKWKPSFLLDFTSIKKIWRFSGNLFIFNVINYFQRNVDSFLIGRFLGSVDLGFYNLAYKILLFPLQSITFIISRASYPVYSRYQDNRVEIGNHYLETLENIAFFTAPIMAIIWTLREPFLVTLLGEKWLPSANILAFLAPVGFFQSMVSTSGSVLSAIGRPDILRNLGLVGVPLLVFSIIAGLPWGVVGVAIGYCIANFIWIYPVIKTVLKQLDLSFFDFLKATYIPTLSSLVSSALLRLFLNTDWFYTMPAPITLLSFGFLFVVCYLIIIHMLSPTLIPTKVIMMKPSRIL